MGLPGDVQTLSGFGGHLSCDTSVAEMTPSSVRGASRWISRMPPPPPVSNSRAPGTCRKSRPAGSDERATTKLSPTEDSSRATRLSTTVAPPRSKTAPTFVPGLESPNGRHMFNVLASFDEYELDIRREYWAETKARVMRSGGAHLGRTPLGYLCASKQPKRACDVTLERAGELLAAIRSARSPVSGVGFDREGAAETTFR